MDLSFVSFFCQQRSKESDPTHRCASPPPPSFSSDLSSSVLYWLTQLAPHYRARLCHWPCCTHHNKAVCQLWLCSWLRLLYVLPHKKKYKASSLCIRKNVRLQCISEIKCTFHLENNWKNEQGRRVVRGNHIFWCIPSHILALNFEYWHCTVKSHKWHPWDRGGHAPSWFCSSWVCHLH